MARNKWPYLGPVLMSKREEQAWLDRTNERRITTEETLRQDLEDSLRNCGLVYCDQCGMWFQSGCLCDDFRDKEL